MRYDVIVKRQAGSKQFGVYGVTIADNGARKEELLEGGFFEQCAAREAAREYLSEAAARAERAAGWDGSR